MRSRLLSLWHIPQPVKNSYSSTHMRGKHYDNDWTTEELENFGETTQTRLGLTIPVNTEIRANQKILDYTMIEEILKKATRYAIVDCVCRTTRGNCDAPLDVCLSLDEIADKTVEAGVRNPHYVSYEEALDAVRRGHEAGLVLMAYSREGASFPKSICSCCTCCCTILGGILRFGTNMPISLVTSDRVAEHNPENCMSCGACVNICHFEAWENNNGVTVYHPERCFGCGNCSASCPADAITMKPRNQQ